jgi:tripeptide aminopeptidase
VPDEEIGLFGSKVLDLDKFKVDFAYTIDGAERGEVVVETFNAGEVRIEIDGVTAHPISAKGVMVNPLLVATDIMSHFDRLDTPEHTEGREGYFWFKTIQSTPRHTTLNLNIRDFDLTQYEARKQFVRDVIKFEQVRHPKAKIVADIEDIYGNISSFLGDDRTAVDVIYEVLDELGIKPITKPMRGGTDGSALSARGLVTPNYFTGAHNFHSSAEFLPIPSYTDSLAMTLKLIELLSQKRK